MIAGRSGTRRRNTVLPKAAFYVVLEIILLYIIFPFYWAFRSAITPDADLFATPVQYFPNHPTLHNFQLVLSDTGFLTALKNSAIVAVSVTILALAIGATASYALGRFHFRGRTPVLYLVLSMTMFPQVAVLGALWNMINQLGFYDHLYALILTYLVFTLPFTVWVLTSFFRALPSELEEAAYVDGASPFQTFWKIMLPLVAPGLVTTGLLAFISAWNEFLYALSFIQSPENRTVPLAIFNFVPATNVGSNFVTPWGQMMAATVVVTVPLVVLTLIFQRRILAGLTAGAVKG